MSLAYERRLSDHATARSLFDSAPEKVAHNAELLGDMTRGALVAHNLAPLNSSEALLRYYLANRTDERGLRVGGGFKRGFGQAYTLTHETTNYQKQKKLTCGDVCDGEGRVRALWAEHADGFDAVEEHAHRCAARAHPELGELLVSAWHLLEQPPAAGDSTSFGVHTDSQDQATKDAVVTVVVKLTYGASKMYMEGARCTFNYADAPSSATFRADAWHRSIPIPPGGTTALKIAFFYKKKRACRQAASVGSCTL